MPIRLPVGSNYLAQLRSLAARGDAVSSALFNLLDNTYYVALTLGAEAGNVIRVSGQVTDQDGQKVTGVKDIVVESISIASAGTLAAVASNGTVKFGAASKKVWVQTLADGSFKLDLTNATAEDNLVIAQLDNGTVEIVKATFV